ncbi:MAG TPA: FHA domain-containing protein [Planctomycetota bacterium]
MAKLTIKDESGTERVHELVDDITTVGRASLNILQITDEKASRHHFRVEKDGERFKLVDLGSTNGTKLNGYKIQSPTYLRKGDVITLGKTTFAYDGPGAAVAPPVSTDTPALSKPVTAPAPEAPPAIQRAPESHPGDTVALEPLKEKVPAEKPAAQPEGPKFVLKVLEGADVGKNYELGNRPLTIGRHNSNTIQIIDDAVSNYHAEINREPIGYVLTDLGSTNGTRVKVKGKPEFEKVVKTPLSAGMQIRCGKTVLEYENVGQPSDQLFGTVALDPEKLAHKLAEPGRGIPMRAVAAVAIILLAGVSFGVYKLVTRGPAPSRPDDPKVAKPDFSNRIANGDFSQGTDDLGNPKSFRVERGCPDVKVAVIADADHNPAPAPTVDPTKADPKPPEPKPRLGLQVTKAGRSPSALTAVETDTSFAVDPAKVYEFGGWLKNDGDGLFGLRMTWIQGDRAVTEHPVVLKDTQEWKERSANLKPPSWATRARAGIFVQGKEGKACFDDLRLTEKPGVEIAPPPSIRFQGIGVNFEGTKGMFAASSGGQRVIEDGMLLLISPDGSAISDLTSAIEPHATQESAKAAMDGRIYDFALQEPVGYKIQAQPGAAGIDLRVAADSPSENASRPQLRFYVVGTVAQGDVEITKGDDSTERMTGSDPDKSLPAVKELLFNSGKSPQFDLMFAKPAQVEIKREGVRRKITIQFKGEVQFAMGPESVAAKQGMQAAIDDLQRSADARKWGEAFAKAQKVADAFAVRYPQARDAVSAVNDKLDKQLKADKEEVKTAMDALNLTKNEAAATSAKDLINRQQVSWAAHPYSQELNTKLALIDEFIKTVQNTEGEKKAEADYKKAEQYFNIKQYEIAAAYARNMLKDEAIKATKAGAKAKDLLTKCEAQIVKNREIVDLDSRLRAKTKNYIAAQDYKGAIEAIEKDKEYQDHAKDLEAINQLLADWKKKLQ